MNQALVPATAHLPAPSDSLESYLQAVNAIPVLQPDEEQALAKRLRDHGELDAARQLVLSHLRFVVHVARGYSGYGLPLGDLIQEGNIGLMKAVRRFDPEQKVRLVSFAVHWIRAEIHEFVLKNWRIVKVATTKAQRKLFFNLRSAKKRLGWLNRDEVDAVAHDLGVKPETVLEMEQRLAAHDMTFDPAPTTEDEDRMPGPASYLTAANADPAEALERQDWEAASRRQLQQALHGLDSRSRDIVTRRWLEEPKCTLQELADEYRISAERIRQIENHAFKKLRFGLEA
jgi:RNA polymerase sigma-32 factor